MLINLFYLEEIQCTPLLMFELFVNILSTIDGMYPIWYLVGVLIRCRERYVDIAFQSIRLSNLVLKSPRKLLLVVIYVRHVFCPRFVQVFINSL